MTGNSAIAFVFKMWKIAHRIWMNVMRIKSKNIDVTKKITKRFVNSKYDKLKLLYEMTKN